MNIKKISNKNDFVSNWKSVLYVHTKKKKEISINEIECYLQKYFSKYTFIIHQYFQMNNYMDKQTFEEILRNSDVVIDKITLESLWNSCQPSDKGISYEIFRQHFRLFEIENNQNLNQCQISNYATLINHPIENHWQDLKKDFISLDRDGRLTITIDQAINLMRKYYFPLNNKQQCEFALLFSPKNNGQFHYFEFLQYFTQQISIKNHVQRRCFRSIYSIQTKQSWSILSITIDDILHRIRSQCILKYENIYRMLKKFDQYQQGYITKIQFKQLLKQFDINLNEHEFYHLISEIDKNQDGIITYDELYYSLITSFL